MAAPDDLARRNHRRCAKVNCDRRPRKVRAALTGLAELAARLVVEGREFNARRNYRAGGRLGIYRSCDRSPTRHNAQSSRARDEPLAAARESAPRAPNIEFVRAEVTDPVSLPNALQGASAIVCSVQFEGYPIENPSAGLTFERVDYGGTVALLEAAKKAGADHFIYISGAAADENSTHPGFCAKGQAERAIRESGLAYTIFRPSLVYGPETRC